MMKSLGAIVKSYRCRGRTSRVSFAIRCFGNECIWTTIIIIVCEADRKSAALGRLTDVQLGDCFQGHAAFRNISISKPQILVPGYRNVLH